MAELITQSHCRQDHTPRGRRAPPPVQAERREREPEREEESMLGQDKRDGEGRSRLRSRLGHVITVFTWERVQ